MSTYHKPTPYKRWLRYQHVIFDCDSTLSRIEGIDELASHADTRSQVAMLTNAAMDGGVPLDEVYGERLSILNPTRGAVRALKHKYKRNVVEDAAQVISGLQNLGHDVYIVSGGLFDPVREFGLSLGVPVGHIRAVDIEFDQLSGAWWDEKSGPWQERYLAYQRTELAESDGKAEIIRELLRGKTGRSLLVGDGVSDLLAAESVNLFVGYCGVVKRDRVSSEAPLYIDCSSLAPLICIAADSKAVSEAGPDLTSLAGKGRKLIENNALHFNDAKLADSFNATLHASSRTDETLFSP